MEQSCLQNLELVSLRSVGKSVLVLSDKGPFKVRRGILRFFGTVEFASGQFCGIELNAPQGKHNGSFKGIRYFQCTPDHGIFVPAEKVYYDPNSKNRSNVPSNSVNHKNILKKAQSDVQISIGQSTIRVHKDTISQETQIPPNSNLFEILSTISTDVPYSNDDKKSVNTQRFHSHKYLSKNINSKVSPPSRQCNELFPSKFTEPIVQKSVISRPSSVINASNRNSLAIQSSSSDTNNISLVRHSSLTDIDISNLKQTVLSEKPTNVQHIQKNSNDEISLNRTFSSAIDNCSETSRFQDQSYLYLQQNILTTSIIPKIPQYSETSVQMNSFYESSNNYVKESDIARIIMEIIDRDKYDWEEKMQMLQKSFLKLKDDVEELCFQHLEVLSNVPSEDVIL
ncbi:Restin-like protein isoform X7 [Oopsacas minuta]|uniref:Restin-like protein isoform X7 n=1 Tax=Oopsacas minuta TaxID=111878 RepID=A0AAV7KM32_9METZ|nr:Restin-like protein isoform X7 [Oopsacas minuta]